MPEPGRKPVRHAVSTTGLGHELLQQVACGIADPRSTSMPTFANPMTNPMLGMAMGVGMAMLMGIGNMHAGLPGQQQRPPGNPPAIQLPDHGSPDNQEQQPSPAPRHRLRKRQWEFTSPESDEQ